MDVEHASQTTLRPTAHPTTRSPVTPRFLWALCFCLGLALFSSACGANGSVRLPFLNRAPQDVAALRVDRALDDARNAVLDQPAHEIAVRYNPATCECPAWEALLYGEWQRVDLVPTPLRADQTMQRARLQTTGETLLSSSGWRYPRLRWQAVTP